jgi:Holliday junction DNA helicase RuvA
MICRLTGRVAGITDETAVLELAGVGYEVMVPAAALAELQPLLGQEVTLFTVQYFEGNPAGSNLIPRLVGFLRETDREFFQLFTRVKGISSRRALRAMSLPTPHLIAAIEHGDVHVLTSLPEIGKKIAAQVIAELRGKLPQVATAAIAATPATQLTDAQRIAVDILVRWGDRRIDAQEWVRAAVQADPALAVPEAIVRAAYRAKTQP